MMVTFISQCEKKALSKTRRVLDAFANRIGDRAWQTVITQEGLNAVRKLLKKTASKNTAVSCRWMRSRSRSELVWVVGCRRAFNHSGLVPVNYTSKEIIMDRLSIEMGQLIANTKKQPLSHHLFAVGVVAYYLLEKMKVKNEKLKQSAFISGILHDIGKIDPEFQHWVNTQNNKLPEDVIPEDGVHIEAPKKFSFEKHPRHHEISWLLSEALLAELPDISKPQRIQIAHGIYWHHTKPFRKEDKFTDAEKIFAVFNASLSGNNFYDIYMQVKAVLNDVAKFSSRYDVSELLPEFAKKFELTDKSLPIFKKYDNVLDNLNRYKEDVSHNALNNLVRAVVISADRIVSSCSFDDLEEYLAEHTLHELVDNQIQEEEGPLLSSIQNCLTGFEKRFPASARNITQGEASNKLAEMQKYAVINESANIIALQGPAGCGKTKIALEWAKQTNAKKIIWVCPRVQVCLGLLYDLTSEEYLPDCQIEIFTGEYKKTICGGILFEDAPDTDENNYFSGDIVITTIDQAVNTVITHHKVTALIDLMQAHVVFDEFHELINMPAFNLLFAELIEVKKAQGAQANTLLVSATPHYFFLKEFLDIPDEDIVTIDSFNNSRYRIEFRTYDDEETSPLISESQDENTFVISNTARDAQLGYLTHHAKENSVLLHSKYTKQDKSYWFNQVFDSFKRDGDRRFNVLRSGPIIQASLNITCDRMLTELTCAENWLQRLGRLDRFGVNSEVNCYITVLPESIEKEGKQTSSCARFLNQLCVWQSTKAWHNFLKDKLQEEVSINNLYKYYREFYAHSASCNAIEQDFLMALKKSAALIMEKVIDPISVPPKSKRNDGVIKISLHSLRGDNRFVQMAICKVTEELELEFTNDYAYREEFDSAMPQANLTESVESMRGYGEDNNNLVQYMRKKHHNIKHGIGYKQARNEWELIKEARSPETPIYLSYTPKDLEPVGGLNAAHPQAVYYVISNNKQPVGAMSIARLKQHTQKSKTEK